MKQLRYAQPAHTKTSCNFALGKLQRRQDVLAQKLARVSRPSFRVTHALHQGSSRDRCDGGLRDWNYVWNRMAPEWDKWALTPFVKGPGSIFLERRVWLPS